MTHSPQVAFVSAPRFYSLVGKRRLALPAKQPIAIARRGWILDACEAAECFEVRAGIRLGLARRRCAELRVLEYDPADYAEASFVLWSCCAEITPLVEPVDQAQGFLGLTGCAPRGKSLDELLTRMALTVYERTGLLLDWAAGQDRWIARLACGENARIDPSGESALLEKLRIERLGLATELCERLRRYGIRTAAELLRTPRAFIETHLQVPRSELDPFVRRGDSVVHDLFPPQEIMLEIDLDGGIDGELEQAIAELARRAEVELRIGDRQAGQIAMSLRDQHAPQEASARLAKPVASRQTIAAYLHAVAQEMRPALVRNLRVTLSTLTSRQQPQTELWQHRPLDPQPQEQLDRARQILTRKYGRDTIRSGRDYAEQTPPRFAQMILERRGLFLP